MPHRGHRGAGPQALHAPYNHIDIECPIYSKAKTSVSFAEGKDTAYPMKKHTISLPINEKRMQRSNFLWKYLKTKI